MELSRRGIGYKSCGYFVLHLVGRKILKFCVVLPYKFNWLHPLDLCRFGDVCLEQFLDFDLRSFSNFQECAV